MLSIKYYKFLNCHNGIYQGTNTICRLLDVLAGRKDPRGLKGEILFDGVPPPDNFKCMVGYVVQVSLMCNKIDNFYLNY